MTIEYKDSKRIVALSTDEIGTPTLEDDFTTRKTGWSANTTRCVIDNTTDEEMDLSLGDGGDYAELLSYPLDATASDTKWILDFDYELETLSAGTTGGGQIAVGLSGEGTNGFTTAQDFLGLLQEHDNGSYEWFACIDTDGTALNSTGGDTQLTNLPTTATQYHFRVIRLSATSYKVQSFSGSARTSDLLIEEKTGTCASTIQTLTHIKCHARQYSSGNRTATVRVDNIKFYDNVSSLTNKPTDIQDNSIMVEKDTARRYWASNKDTIEDDYSSTSGWTSSGAGNISITGGQVSASSLGNNDQEDRIYRTVSGVDSTDVTIQFEVTFSAWTSGAWAEGIAQLQSCTQDAVTYSGTQPDCDVAGVNLNKGHSNSQFSIITKDGTNSAVFTSGTATVSQGTKYYLTFEKSGNDMTLTSRTGSHSGSTHDTITKTQTGITGLNTLVHGTLTGYAGGTGYTTSYTIDNLVVSPVSHATWTMQPTKQFDFSSSTGWTESDSNDIGVANGKLNWYNNGTNTYENAYYDLGSVSDTKWILRHTLKVSGSPSSDEIPYQFIISNTANANWNTSSSCLGVWVYVDRNNAWRRIYTANKVNSTSGGDNGAQASPRYWSDFAYDTTYYITTTRTSATNMTVEIRTGSHSGSIVSNGTLTLTIPSGITGLRYLTANQGAQGTGLSMEVDDVEFYNGVTSV